MTTELRALIPGWNGPETITEDEQSALLRLDGWRLDPEPEDTPEGQAQQRLVELGLVGRCGLGRKLIRLTSQGKQAVAILRMMSAGA